MQAQKLTFKEKLFAQKYVENKGNGTQTALQVYNTTDPKTASVIAAENLAKPRVQESIDEIAKAVGVTSSTVLDKFKQISAKETDKWTGDTILKANIEMAKILGLYPGTKHARLNINMRGTIKDMNHSEVKQELKVIDSELNNILEDNPPTTEPDVVQ